VTAFLLQGSVVDVGHIPVDSTVWFSLTLQNPLQEPLTLFDVNASCGCLVTSFRPRQLKSGEIYEVELTLKARSVPGAIKERIRVFSTSSELNELEINVKGEAKSGPTINGDLEFGTIRPEFGAEAFLSVHGLQGWLTKD